jgi:predicted SAM-dependent methyltransferase
LKNNHQLKIDIGAGASPKDGFVSVDLYASADIQDDITKLDHFKDNTVTAVNTSHVLEHISFDDIPKAFSQVYRVLTPGGLWTIEVPDLEWILKDFLNTPESKRWGWKIQTIFGLQNHPGEFHKTGFTVARLGELLISTGFIRIKTDAMYSQKYRQGVIRASAIKPG